MPEEHHVPVLVVGGGYAGLTASLSLAWRGVPNILAERHPGTSTQPKAFGLTYRTMELLRVFPGMEQALMEFSQVDFAAEAKIAVASSLTDPAAKMIYGGDSESLRFLRDLTPAPYAGIGQAQAERILRAKAQEYGADVRFGTELVAWHDEGDSVVATLRDRAGAQTVVRASYLIAADGHRGAIREQLGVPVHGRGTLTSIVSILFDAELDEALKGREFVLWFLQNPSFTGVFVHPEPGSYILGVNCRPGESAPLSGFTDDRCAELIRAGVGIPGLAVKIRDKNSFDMAHQVAERFGAGRVFLAGDAAHVVPPTGGLGGNTAIQDGYDIAWRLALVIGGVAGEGLLGSYDCERRPVGQLTADQQLTNFAVRMMPALAADLAKPVDLASLHMGYRYHSTAVCTEPGDDGGLLEDPRCPTGRPGSRAAHLPLEREGARLSTIDLFGSGFVLLTGPDGQAWARAGTEAALRLGLPLEVHSIGADFKDVEGLWAQRYGAASDGAVLVRPDGYTAWRSAGGPGRPDGGGGSGDGRAAAELHRALAQILHRPQEHNGVR